MPSHTHLITYSNSIAPASIYPINRSKVLLKAVALGGLVYIIKKVIEVITTRPLADPQNYTKREYFYAVCADIRQGIGRKIGEENWEAINFVILDNSWFSAFAISFLPPEEKGPSIHATIINGIQLATSACSFSFGAWLLRTVVAARLPSCLSKVAAFVAPKGYPQARL